MSTALPQYVYTSIRYFFSIAQEAIAFVRADQKARFTPRPDGQPGGGIKWDPEQKGFKTSFIAIMFSGTFIEAALHQLIASRNGIEETKRTDKWTYEKKLRLLGCDDASLFAHCKEYSAARREIVHEKAYLEDGNLRIAQKEADRAFELVEKIIELFDLRIKLSLPQAPQNE